MTPWWPVFRIFKKESGVNILGNKWKYEEFTITNDSKHCNVLSDGKHSSAMKVKGYNFLIKTVDNMKIQSTTNKQLQSGRIFPALVKLWAQTFTPVSDKSEDKFEQWWLPMMAQTFVFRATNAILHLTLCGSWEATNVRLRIPWRRSGWMCRTKSQKGGRQIVRINVFMLSYSTFLTLLSLIKS